MEITNDYKNNNYFNQTETSIPTNKIQYNSDLKLETDKKLKIADYFDSVYSYPPKIKIKWDILDELRQDSFVKIQRGSFEKNLLDIDFIKTDSHTESLEGAASQNYSRSTYFDGFLNKINSSNYFIKKTKTIQSKVSNIPVFIIMNGNGEIVLKKPVNILKPKSLTNYISTKIYDSCGAFDSIVEKSSSLGLFFMDFADAKEYFNEIFTSDIDGAETVGLSIHCISLDSAYRITREHHPGIDFRFVPNFNEVKNLLLKDVGSADDMAIESSQQQIRFTPRFVNMFSILNGLGKRVSNSFIPIYSSFLQRNEYFKGVPIYMVQISNKPRNFWAEQYSNIGIKLEKIICRTAHFVDYTTGFGHRWLQEGSLDFNNIVKSDKLETFIFFEKDQARKFCKKHGRKIYRQEYGQFFRWSKPKILVYNLEDFLEDWEDHVLEKLPNGNPTTTRLVKNDSGFGTENYKNINFISPTSSYREILDFSQDVNKFGMRLNKVTELLNVKYRVLKRAVGVFFSL